MLVLLYERFQMRTQALRIDIERGLSIDLGQTIADKVGRNPNAAARLAMVRPPEVIEEQVVRLCATTVVLVQDIAQATWIASAKRSASAWSLVSSLAAIPCGG